MVDRDVLSARLAALRGYLEALREVGDVDRETFVRTPARHHLAERYLHLACEAVLDIAHHVISDQGLRQPDSYRDAMRILAEAGHLPPDLAPRLQAWMGMRNVLVHLYLAIDHGRVWDAVTEDIEDLEQFAAAIARLL